MKTVKIVERNDDSVVIVENHLGTINISQQYLSTLIGGTVTNCFGVVDMNISNRKQGLMEIIPIFKNKGFIDKGVEVKYIRGKLYINLHISVMYGVNVSTVVKSIMDKVRYVVEEEAGVSVSNVNVYVDNIKV